MRSLRLPRRPPVAWTFIAERRRATYVRAVMIELTLLGLQSVRASDGREFGSLAAQPKRFAFLAYLAIAGGAGYHRRDALTAMFWPELDQFAARRALRNTLYHLREAIGNGVLITRGDDAIAIDPDVADVRRDEAERRGRWKGASKKRSTTIEVSCSRACTSRTPARRSRSGSRANAHEPSDSCFARCVRWWSATRRPEITARSPLGPACVRIGAGRRELAATLHVAARCRRRSRQRASAVRELRAQIGSGVQFEADHGIDCARGSHTRW